MYSILKKIADTASTKEKEAIIRGYASNETLKNVFRLAYHPRLNFGFSRKTFPVYDAPDVPMHCLNTALEKLESEFSTRKVTGNMARDCMRFTIGQLSPEDADVIRRVVLKDLEIGAGVSIANKVWKDLIPDQPQMNCEPQDDDLIQKIIDSGSAVEELKADGQRMYLDLAADEDLVAGYTRGASMYQQIEHVTEVALATNFRNWVIDGELVYRPNNSKVVESRKKSNGIASKMLQGSCDPAMAKCMVYQVWDMVPRDVYWGERECPDTLTFEERRKYLESFVIQCASFGASIEIMEQTPIKSIDEAKAQYYKRRADGYEGSIIKSLKNVWKNTRVSDMVKFKAKEPIDVEIVGVYPHKKDPEKLGGFIVRTACGLAQSKVGSGFKDTDYKTVTVMKNGKKAKEKVWVELGDRHDLDRRLLWSIRHKLIGLIVEIETNEPITSKARKDDEPEFSFYLPIIKRFRPDKNKAQNLGDVFKK